MRKKSKRIIRILKGRVGIAILAVVLLCLFVAGIGGCNKDKKGSKVVFTKGLEKDDVFRIGDEICKTSEMMVFLATTQYEYESVYGREIWSTSLNGVTLEHNVKETVLEKVAQIKSMYLLAKQKGVSLTDQEKSLAAAAARAYIGRLSAGQKDAMGVSEETVQKLYEEYALAKKVYQKVIEDVNPEISDDEARTVTVQHILIRTGARDAQGNWKEFLTAQKQEAYEEASEIRAKASSGEKSFEELASRYSQDVNLTYSFGKGEMDPAFEAAAFAMETGEISTVVECADGYHILKCISTFNQEETMENKQRLLTAKKNEVFGEEYDAFVETLVRKLNQSVWDDMGFFKDGNTPDADFFEIYGKFFKE